MMNRPKLEDYKAPSKLSQYPEATCFQAGHLVTKNAGWRNKRPVINKEKCVGCQKCYLYCPDGVIDKEQHIDYDFCKGCGICSNVCKLGAIKMEVEDGE